MRKKVRDNKGDRTKTVLQEGMNKSKSFFHKKLNKGDFFEGINRRNIRERESK